MCNEAGALLARLVAETVSVYQGGEALLPCALYTRSFSEVGSGGRLGEGEPVHITFPR